MLLQLRFEEVSKDGAKISDLSPFSNDLRCVYDKDQSCILIFNHVIRSKNHHNAMAILTREPA